jgi:multisubunit Na+/H+ antiporter MnhB subunit
MDWLPTLALLTLAIGLMVLARQRLAARAEPGRIRLVPWTAVLFLGVLLALLAAAHVLTLCGFHIPENR